MLHAELYVIYQEYFIGKKIGNFRACLLFWTLLLCVNLLKNSTHRFHVYAVLIQDVKDLMEQSNIVVCHTLIDIFLSQTWSLLRS